MRKIITAAITLLTIVPAFGDTVEVKFAGLVDLNTYVCTDTISSFVNRICFDEAKARVVVLLRDTYYAYCDVDPGTVAGWIAAESKGRFYNQNVKSDAVDGRFACK
jgi:hypothetical protein